MARCSGREHPSGLTFAPSTNGRTRCFPNRYCGARTSISPNFVCQRSFFRLGDASAGVGESPAPSPRPAARPNCATPPVPEDASPRPSALPPRRLPSMPPRRLRPPAQSTTPAGEAPDAPATPPSAPHRSTPRPPSVASRQINQSEPTLHRFESHPPYPSYQPNCALTTHINAVIMLLERSPDFRIAADQAGELPHPGLKALAAQRSEPRRQRQDHLAPFADHRRPRQNARHGRRDVVGDPHGRPENSGPVELARAYQRARLRRDEILVRQMAIGGRKRKERPGGMMDPDESRVGDEVVGLGAAIVRMSAPGNVR